MNVETLQDASHYRRFIGWNEAFQGQIREEMETFGSRDYLQKALTDAKERGGRYREAYGQIAAAVDRVQPDQLREILKLHYLEGCSLRGAAYEMGYTYQYIRQLHVKALKAFEAV